MEGVVWCGISLERPEGKNIMLENTFLRCGEP